MSKLADQIGIPEIATIGEDELIESFLPASVAGLSDGDMVVHHSEYFDETKIRFYGRTIFNGALVANKIHETAMANGREPTSIYFFQALAAQYCDAPNSPFVEPLTKSSVQILPEIITIDDNPLAIPRVPNLVLDYTACLSSRSLIKDQIDFVQRGFRPFTFTPITRLHFTNRLLMQAYDKNAGEGAANLFIENRLYIGREDGIASATDEMIQLQTEHGARSDIADVIICNGDQHTTEEDLKTGAKNAYTLIKEAGMFVIRAFAKPSSTEIGTDQIADWAFEAGFEEKEVLEYYSAIHSPGAAILRPQAGVREIKTIILTK